MTEKAQLKRLQNKIEELEAERAGLLESLKGCEDRLRFIYDSSPLGMGFIDTDGIMADCNAALGDILGASPEQLVGFKMRSEIRDEGMAVAIARAFAGRTSAFEGEYTTVPGDRKIALRSIFTPLWGGDGAQKGVLFIAENISERKQTEDRLRESESRYKAIVESQAEFVVRYLPGGVITFVNDTLCRYIGIRREDLLGRSYYPFMHPDDRDAFVKSIESLDRDRPSLVAEARVVLPGGRVTWHRWTHHAVFDGSGRLVEYQCTGRDVTELKEAEERLRQSEELYRQLYEAESDAIFLVDNERGRILMANSAAAAMYGYSVDELLSLPNDALSAEPEETRKVTSGTATHDNVVNIPLRYHRKKDGTVFPVEVTGRFFRLRDRPVHISAIRDISRRMAADQALQEGESKYRRLYNETPVLLHSIDRKGVLIEVNGHWLRTLGYERHEVIGRKVTDFFSEASRKHAIEAVQPAFFRDGVVRDVPYQFVKKNGDVVDVLLSATGVRDEEGRVVRSQAVSQDVTERKRAEEQVRRFSEDLQRLLTVTREMTATTDLARLYRSAVQTAADLLRFDFSTVMILSEDKRGLTIMDAVGFPQSMTGTYTLVEGQGLSTFVVGSKQPGSVVDFREEKRFEIPAVIRDLGIRSALCVPMMIGEEVFGVLIGHTLGQRTFSDEDIATYESIGSQAAIAIRNAMNLQSLGKSERMLKTIIDAEPECVKLLDRDANLILMNRSGLDMIQVGSLEDVRGKCVCPMIGDADRDAFMDLTRRVFRGESGTLTFEMIGVKGRRLMLETHAVPLRNEQNEIVALLGVTRDVTAKKQADEALRASENRFRTLIENAASGILVADLETRKFLYANPVICRMLGYNAGELRNLAVESIHPAEEIPRVQAAFAGQEGLQTRCIRKDGTVFPVEILPVEMELDGRRCLAGFFTDVTEKRLLEQERLKSQKLESIGTLAGGIAHDFNNLLQGIFGYLSMARLNFDKRQKALSMLEQAERALQQAMGLTSQLLTFSKGGKPVRQRMPLLPVIENSARFALSGSRSRCRFDLEPGLWWVDGDGGQLGQVIQNLVLNADQAMPLGGVVTVTARNVPGGDASLPQGMPKRDHVMVSVRDSGVGIPANYLSRIFDPYFTTKEKGSGLGLATSYSIIRNHDGIIIAESEQGKGSLFTLWLPSDGPGQEQGTRAPAVCSLRKGRVLVLDDEEVVRNVAEELLRELGHEAETAENGEAAIEAYRRARDAGRPFDVVVLDLTVRGGMGGIDTLRVLRGIDPDVKAVVSSGYSDDTGLSEHRRYGFRAFLKKPYDLTELRDILSALIT